MEQCWDMLSVVHGIKMVLRQLRVVLSRNRKPLAAGPCEFGVDEDIARIILTVMRFDPAYPECGEPALFRNAVLKVMESLLLDMQVV